MLRACFVADHVNLAWLALAAARLWATQGPTRSLIGAVSYLPWVLIERRQAYRVGYRLMRRLLAVGEKRDYQPELSDARVLYTNLCHWAEPLEEQQSRGWLVREGLIRAGELQAATLSYYTSVGYVDVAATLDECAAEVDAAVAFAARTGDEVAANTFRPYRWLVAVLRGDDSPDTQGVAIPSPASAAVVTSTHIARALAAALFDNPASLAEHSRAAMASLPTLEATYLHWQAKLVRALALADHARAATDHAAELAELDEIADWMAGRADDMPANFGHMRSLIEAERAWAVDDLRKAIDAFDTALRHASHRPWHRAFIAERFARFMLAHGFGHSGWMLLTEARDAYRLWGAHAKVNQIDRAYPSLEIPSEPSTGHAARRSSITAGAIDMLAIVNASRALSSETSIPALHTKVVEVLSAMTGATDITMVVWSDEQREWLAATDETDGLAPLDQRHRAPSTVLRYVERKREPLVVGDAMRDDRFGHDPYFLGLQTCSVIAVPVLGRDALRAILVLENRLIRDALPVERLEGVTLIAGQLAVSLDNALIYSSLERKVGERTQELARANKRLARLSITDPLTGLANRRQLDVWLHDESERAQRMQAPLSLLMVDIDHFKQYNDQYGHQEGDRCLQRIATQFHRNIRDTDLAARYGGEEFAIVMPNTDSAAAHKTAERIRLSVTALAEPSTTDIEVTVSIGVATLQHAEPLDTDQVAQPDHLVERADAALYRAKRAGRNRVCSEPNTR
jgi:diguanylate cyclase (GGDEF)-like protein